MKSSNTPTRGRILESAARLFERDGIRGTTVDAIAEGAGVTKRTFYYHFRSKDDLIAATLEDARVREFEIDVSGATPLREIVNEVFDIIEESASDIRWKGGSFSRTIAELAGLPGHPAATLARVHKKRMEAAFQAIIEHGDAEGAGGSQNFGTRIQRLRHTGLVDPLTDLLLHPGATTTTTTTEALAAVSAHLRDFVAVQHLEHA